jgi:hypothetical protein
MARKIFYLDAATNKRQSISQAKLDKKLDEFLDQMDNLIKKHAPKLKKINGGTLQSFDINIGISGGLPVLTVSGGLTLSYKV